MGDARAYVKSVWEQKAMIATWPPLEPVQVGDIYEIHKGVPKRRGSISDGAWQISYDEDPPSEDRGDWTAKSKDGVDIQAKLSGKTPAGIVLKSLTEADIGVIVSLSSVNSFVLSLRNLQYFRMTNPAALGPPLRAAWLKFFDGWDSEWLVVSEVLKASTGTFLSGSTSETQFELKAKAAVNAASISIADLASEYTFAGSHDGGDEFVGKTVSPLFRAVKLKIGGIGLGGVRSMAESDVPESERTVEVVKVGPGPLRGIV